MKTSIILIILSLFINNSSQGQVNNNSNTETKVIKVNLSNPIDWSQIPLEKLENWDYRERLNILRSQFYTILEDTSLKGNIFFSIKNKLPNEGSSYAQDSLLSQIKLVVSGTNSGSIIISAYYQIPKEWQNKISRKDIISASIKYPNVDILRNDITSDSAQVKRLVNLFLDDFDYNIPENEILYIPDSTEITHRPSIDFPTNLITNKYVRNAFIQESDSLLIINFNIKRFFRHKYNMSLIVTDKTTGAFREINSPHFSIYGDLKNISDSNQKTIVWDFKKDISSPHGSILSNSAVSIKLARKKRYWGYYAITGGLISGTLSALCVVRDKFGCAPPTKISSYPGRPPG